MSDPRRSDFLPLLRQARRGRLKLFLGPFHGVGKTWAMLEEGELLRRAGFDVAAALPIAGHWRETVALGSRLPSVPPRVLRFQGAQVREMDLNAVLQRRPEVLLLDDLAYVNAPTGRHADRFTDMEAILAAGIHVMATLDATRLEGMAETCGRILDCRIVERAPDRVLAMADRIAWVDLEPALLARRLAGWGPPWWRERGDEAQRTALLARLREAVLAWLAPRLAAGREETGPEGVVEERGAVLVCLGPRGPDDERLVRGAARLARCMGSGLLALHVRTGNGEAQSQEEAGPAESGGLAVARRAGAEVASYWGNDVAETVRQFARENGVGIIVAGAPARPVPAGGLPPGRSLVHRLLEPPGPWLVVVTPTAAGQGE